MNELVQNLIAVLLLILAVGYLFRNLLFKKKDISNCGCEPSSCECASTDVKN